LGKNAAAPWLHGSMAAWQGTAAIHDPWAPVSCRPRRRHVQLQHRPHSIPFCTRLPTRPRKLRQLSLPASRCLRPQPPPKLRFLRAVHCPSAFGFVFHHRCSSSAPRQLLANSHLLSTRPHRLIPPHTLRQTTHLDTAFAGPLSELTALPVPLYPRLELHE
jgi:hypothetical protein